MKRSPVVLLFGLVMLTLAACGGGERGIVVEDAWVRPSPMEAGNGAVYMVIRNTGAEDDALLAADTDVAQTVEIHETYVMEAEGDAEMGDMGDNMGDDMDMAGEMMGMRPVESVPVPAGGRVTLEPGGYHIMLINVEQLEPGQTIPITLTFEKAGTVEVEAEVREQ
jgi:copper(I)-binding protein